MWARWKYIYLGNNGGDGLVAARHLTCFGFYVKVFYPKLGKKTLFNNLTMQLRSYNVEICDNLNENGNYAVLFRI